MASISEQVLAAAKTCLLAAPQIPEVAGRVERGREDPYAERENGSINIRAVDEQSRVLGEAADDNELLAEFEIYVAVGFDTVWETAADTIYTAMHSRLMAYASWPAGVARIRRTAKRWAGDEGNRTPGLLTVRYAVRYLSAASDAAAVPK